MKRKQLIFYSLIIVLLIIFCSWQYQKYKNNEILMSDTLQAIDNNIKKTDSKIYKVIVYDKVQTQKYSIQNIEEFTSIIDNFDEAILNMNKKGIIKADFDYNLLLYYGEYVDNLGEYRENGRISLDVNVEKNDALRLEMYDGISIIELNGRLEKDTEPFVNPLIEYLIDGIKNEEFSKDVD
jgi:hypothetical protein